MATQFQPIAPIQPMGSERINPLRRLVILASIIVLIVFGATLLLHGYGMEVPYLSPIYARFLPGGNTSSSQLSGAAPIQAAIPTVTQPIGVPCPQAQRSVFNQHAVVIPKDFTLGAVWAADGQKYLDTFGKKSARSAEQEAALNQYVIDFILYAKDRLSMNESENWYAAFATGVNLMLDGTQDQNLLQAGVGDPNCLPIPSEAWAKAMGQNVSKWGIPGYDAVQPPTSTFPEAEGNDWNSTTWSTFSANNGQEPTITSTPVITPTQQVVVIDPNKEGQATIWNLVPLGPEAPTATPNLTYDLPPLQGPPAPSETSLPNPEVLTLEELTSRSWVVELRVDRSECPNLDLSSVTLVPDSNPLGLTYIVDFLPWQEYYVGPCTSIGLVLAGTNNEVTGIDMGESRITGFSKTQSVYVPPTSTPAPPINSDPIEIDLGTLARNYGRSGIVADQSCNGNQIRDFGHVVFRNGTGTFWTKLLIYSSNFVGPCSAVEIVPVGDGVPGMSIWGVDGMVLAGFKDAITLPPVGPAGP